MLPVQDAVPSRTAPWVTVGLIAVLITVLAVRLGLSEPAVRGLILSYGLVPAHLSWPTLLTAPLLHHGVLDSLVGALALWIFGDNVEDRLGRVRYGFLLATGAVVSGLAVVGVNPSSVLPVMGTGGVTGAVIGAHLRLLPASRVLVLVPTWRGIDLVEIPAPMAVLPWFIAGSLAPGVSGAGLPLTLVQQAAGLVTGLGLGRLLARPDRLACDWWNVPVGHSPERLRTSRDTTASSSSSASN